MRRLDQQERFAIEAASCLAVAVVIAAAICILHYCVCPEK